MMLERYREEEEEGIEKISQKRKERVMFAHLKN
jgi:hypothetical protein